MRCRQKILYSFLDLCISCSVYKHLLFFCCVSDRELFYLSHSREQSSSSRIAGGISERERERENEKGGGGRVEATDQ
jgi:hypothetical protein